MTPPEVQNRQNIGQKNPDAVRGAAEGRNAFGWIDNSVQEIENATDKTSQIQAIQNAVEYIKKNTNGNKPALLAKVYQGLSTSPKRELFLKVVSQYASLSAEELKEFHRLTKPPKPSLRSQSPGVYTPVSVKGQAPSAGTSMVQRLVSNLRNRGEILTLSSEGRLIQAGTRDSSVYIVLKGQVEVRINGANGNAARISLGQESIIGEIGALLTGMERTADVVSAQAGTQVLKISAEEFKNYLKINSEARTQIVKLISQRISEQANIFTSEKSVQQLFNGRGDIPDPNSASQSKARPVISAAKLHSVYQMEGAKGLARLITMHVLEQAIQGDVAGLRHWMNIVKGNGSMADASFIFRMFETGQTHLHPTRSLPPDFVMKLGRDKLGQPVESETWKTIEKKVSPRLRGVLEKNGYVTIRDVFVKGDMATLIKLISYDPPPGQASLTDYLQTGSFISSLFRTPKDIENAAYEVARANYKNGVRYLELRFSPDKDGMSTAEVIEAQIRGLKRAEAEFRSSGFKARAIIIFDTVMSTNEANIVANELLDFRKTHPELAKYVVGIDTAGPEVARIRPSDEPIKNPERLGGQLNGEYYFDIKKFSAAFRKLQDAGFRMTTHAGENYLCVEQGLANIARAVEMGTRRIGHGVILGLDLNRLKGQRDMFGQKYTRKRISKLQAWQRALRQRVAQEGIIIEVCPTSNLHTNAGLTLQNHPFRVFLKDGVRFSVSVDNSTTDNVIVSDEMLRLANAKNLTMREFTEMIIRSSAYGMESLPERTASVSSSDLISLAELGRNRFLSDIPSMARDLMKLRNVNDRIAFLSVEQGKYVVRGANAFIQEIVGEKVKGRAIANNVLGREPVTLAVTPAVAKLARGAEYLHIIPIVDSQGETKGYLTIANDDANYLSKASTPQNIDKISRTLGRSIQLAESYSKIRTEYTGADNPVAWYGDTAQALRSGKTITRVVVNLRLKTINLDGHIAGNAYLTSVYQKAIQRFADQRGIRVRVYRRGPNFEIDMPTEVNVESFMKDLYSELLRKPIRFSFKQEGTGELITREVSLSDFELEPRIGAWQYDPARDGKMSVRELRIASAMRASELNKGEGNLQLTRVEVEEVRKYSAEERVVDPSLREQRRIADAWEPQQKILEEAARKKMKSEGIKNPTMVEVRKRVRMQFIEPDSGLFNYEAYQVIAKHMVAEMRKNGSKVTVGYIDGNKIGAFIKSYEFLGDVMVDTIVCRRLSAAAAEVFSKYGIVFARHGSGSEEFYLVGKVDTKTMKEAMEEFNRALEKPIEFKVLLSELEATPEGRMYLEKENPVIDKDSKGRETVIVDLTKLPRGEGGQFSRVTFTGAITEVVDTDKNVSLEKVVEKTVGKAASVAEAAKIPNVNREPVLLLVEADGSIKATENRQKEIAELTEKVLVLTEDAKKSGLRIKLEENRIELVRGEEVVKAYSINGGQLVVGQVLRAGVPKIVCNVITAEGKVISVVLYQEEYHLLIQHPQGSEKYKATVKKIKARFINEGVPEAEVEKAISDLREEIKIQATSLQAQLYFRNLGIQEANRVLDRELAKINPHTSPKRFQRRLARAIRKAQKVMIAVNQKAYNLMLKKAAKANLANLSEAEIMEVFEEMAGRIRADVLNLNAEQLDQEIKITAELLNKKLEVLRNPEGKGFKAHLEAAHFNAPDANLKTKGKIIGASMGRGGVLGGLLGVPLSILRQKLTNGQWNWKQVGSDSFHNALGFIEFEAMNAGAKVLLEMSNSGAMATALGLPVLWSLSSAPSKQRGVVLVHGAVNLGAFMGTSKLVSCIPMPGWLKGTVVLVSGMAGGLLASLGLDLSINKFPLVRKIADNPVTQTLGNIGAVSSKAATAYYTGKLLQNIGSRAGWLRMASIGQTIRASAPLWLVLETCMGSSFSNWVEHDTLVGDLSVLANRKPLLIKRHGYEGDPNRTTKPYSLSIRELSSGSSLAIKSPLAWQLAVQLYEKGFLKVPQFNSSLKGVDFNNAESVRTHFTKYLETIEDDDDLAKGFAKTLAGALMQFKKKAGVVCDEELNPQIRKNIKKLYVDFKVHQEQRRYGNLENQNKKIAWNLYQRANVSLKDSLQTLLGRTKEAVPRKIARLQRDNQLYNYGKILPKEELRAFLKFLRKQNIPKDKLHLYLQKGRFAKYYVQYRLSVKGPAELRRKISDFDSLAAPEKRMIERAYQDYCRRYEGVKLTAGVYGKTYLKFVEYYVNKAYKNSSDTIRSEVQSDVDGIGQMYLADLPGSENRGFVRYLEQRYGRNLYVKDRNLVDVGLARLLLR